MSPQQKAQIAARIERVNAERAVLRDGVTAADVGVTEETMARAVADVAKFEAARKGDRHKLGQAAYMREYRAKQKAARG